MDLEDPNHKDIEQDSKEAMYSRIRWVNKLHHKIWNGKHAGVFCMVISSSAYSVMGLLVKLLTRGSIPSSQIVMARCGVISILAGIGLRHMNYPFFGSPKVRKLVIIRAVLGFFALSAYFYSIQLLPLRDATMLNFTIPVFTAILAMCFLNERWGLAEMIVSEAIEQTKRNILIGTIMAVIGASTGALSYIVVRAIGQCGEPALVSVFAYAVFSTPMAGICLLFQGAKLPSIAELFALCLVGLTAYMAQIFLTRGLQLEKASRATSIQYVKVLVTYFLGVVFLGEIPSIMGAVGGFLIASSSVFISLHR